ncbi:MAG TPA: DUF721 domain-containing protein [Desulfuromonadaceae bacterium]
MAKRTRMRFPQPLSALLNEGLQGLGLAERLREADIWRVWPEVVGPAISSRARPLRIIGGALTVAVSSGPWMQELTFLKGMIREKLNGRLGAEVIREIVLTSGRVEKEALATTDETSRRRRLTARQLAFIDEQSAAIADPEVRAEFAALMRASLESGR